MSTYTYHGRTVDEFTQAYLACALWSSNDESTEQGGEPLDANFDISDIAPAALDSAIADCRDFRDTAGALLDDWTAEQAGHDFWLTRCGHGAGFWDRGLPAGDALTAIAKTWSNRDLYIGDDELIYGFGE